MKPEKGFIAGYEEELKEKEEQIKLREKHNIEEDVIVVEKNNMIKFFFRLLIGIIRTLASIILILLGAIGVITLIYPDIRSEFFKQMILFISEIRIVAEI